MAETTIEEQVTALVAKAAKNDSGALTLPEEALVDVDPAIALAAKSELRYRNTQSSYTKAQKERAKLEGVNKQLTDKLTKNVAVELTAEQQEELKKLESNPEQYRLRKNELENEARGALQQELQAIEQESETLSELEVRKLKLKAFNDSSGIEITDDVIQNQLPAGYIKDLEAGKTTFDEFLKRAQKFLTKTKVVAGAGSGSVDDNALDMSQISGAGQPSTSAQEGDVVETYKSTVF